MISGITANNVFSQFDMGHFNLPSFKVTDVQKGDLPTPRVGATMTRISENFAILIGGVGRKNRKFS